MCISYKKTIFLLCRLKIKHEQAFILGSAVNMVANTYLWAHFLSDCSSPAPETPFYPGPTPGPTFRGPATPLAHLQLGASFYQILYNRYLTPPPQHSSINVHTRYIHS